METIKHITLNAILACAALILSCCTSDEDKKGWTAPSGIGSADIITDWTLTYDNILGRLSGRPITEENGDIYLYGDSEKSMIGYGFSEGHLSCTTLLIPADEIKESWLNSLKSGYEQIGDLSETTSVWRDNNRNILMKIVLDEWNNAMHYQIYWADAR
ncbi:MAG: hypothetical protein K2I51_01255 [Muribaculaceae bacterium]|nr:hypothetical protein [Muribaculaceae bacterium]